jgi:glutathione S-transferase
LRRKTDIDPVTVLYEAFAKFGEQVKGPFWGGSELTHADLALAPWAARLAVLEEHRGFDIKQTNAKFEGLWHVVNLVRKQFSTSVAEWAKNIQALPSFQRTVSEKQYYEKIYMRYLRNEAQSEAAKATRAGTVIP